MKRFGLMSASILFFIVGLLAASAVIAEDAMVIHFKNGRIENVNLGAVQKIEFTGAGSYGTGLSTRVAFGRTYEIVAKHSGKCVDVAGVATHNGANIYQWECHGGPNQRWILNEKEDGFYTVTSQHSNKCMDVEGYGIGNGTNISQYDCHGGPNQLWKFLPQGGGYYRVIAKHSSKCLDVSGGNKGNGDNIHQWDCHGGDNQLWMLK